MKWGKVIAAAFANSFTTATACWFVNHELLSSVFCKVVSHPLAKDLFAFVQILRRSSMSFDSILAFCHLSMACKYEYTASSI